ncbi:MAG TPA: PEGA domain-containing protein [Kofleriaceae bacterium]|jgi:hypothetical protein
MRTVALALLILVRVVHADVGVVATGEPVMQAPLLAHVQGWLQTHHYTLVAVPFPASTANTFIDCFVIEDMGCAQRTFEKESKASNIVYARADLMTGQARDFSVTAYWFVKGHEPATQKRECHACDETQLSAVVHSLMTDLEKGIASTNGTLKVTSVLGGVTVSVDNESVGLAPVERPLSPGRHEITFSHRGTVLETKPVQIEPGATVELAAPELANERPVAPKRSRTTPVSLAIGGALLAAIGGVFLYYGSLDGPDEPYVYTNATKIGAPLSIAGAVGVIGGLVWAGTF